MNKFWKVVWSVLFAAASSMIFTTSYALSYLNVVGLYSETGAGHVEVMKGGKWNIVSIGDKISLYTTIRITVDRDWVEISPDDNPNAVYELDGSKKGPVIKKISDLLKQKPKIVSFPKKSVKGDKNFSGKLVVVQYLGRQRYQANDDADWVDLRYGDILDKGGTVNIIAINSTLALEYPNGDVSNIYGPIRFKVEKLFTGQKLYKYLNVTE